MKDSLNPKCLRVFSTKFHSKESKAFVKSTKIIAQLADDTTLFCTFKEEIYLAFDEIETFGSFSGLLMNKNKTGGIWVGKLYLSGTTHALATKVNIGMTNALIIIIFPRIVKFRFPQEKNKVFILSILFSQFNFGAKGETLNNS
jgi:hypothetical protein